MSTPIDKCGYTFTESYGPEKRYRLILGFENLDDLNAAQDFVLSLRQKSTAVRRSCECPAGLGHPCPLSEAECRKRTTPGEPGE
jgi:hypothetical protein